MTYMTLVFTIRYDYHDYSDLSHVIVFTITWHEKNLDDIMMQNK